MIGAVLRVEGWLRRFSWIEVSGDKECLQCSVLGEFTVLEKKLTLLQGNDASVRFSCPICGFKAVGVVAVDGSEPEPVRHPGSNLHAVPRKPVYNSPAIFDPMESLPQPQEEVYEPPKTDAEAIERAYGEVPDSAGFFERIRHAFLTVAHEVTSGDWRAVPRFTQNSMKLGDVETVDVTVEYLHGDEIIFTCTYPSTAGMPDMEREQRDLHASCKAAIMGPRVMPSMPSIRNPPRGPVAIIPGAWGQGNMGVDNDPVGDPVRQKIMASFRGGG